jgi:HD-like signal output (HDOD) protein
MSCLADDLAQGTVELPSFPEVVTKVRKALNDENSTTDDLVRIIATEPVLAARVLTIANSAAMRTGGDPVSSLNVAVNRLGRKLVRSTAMAFALDRLRSGHKLASVRMQLKALWQRSVHVSSLCYVVARSFTDLDPDEALFIGLMHGIGELYILVRADERPDLTAPSCWTSDSWRPRTPRPSRPLARCWARRATWPPSRPRALRSTAAPTCTGWG